LILFEGQYSGVVIPDRHFIPLRRDGSNMPEVIERLRDTAAIDAMTDRAFTEVLSSGKYGYEAFVRMVDASIDAAIKDVPGVARPAALGPGAVTGSMLLRSRPHRYRLERWPLMMQIARFVAPFVPRWFKKEIKRALGVRPE
jgi:hypothetical protein